MKIKKGDLVVVINGQDRAKTGKVMRVLLTNGKAIVEGINLATKHTKPQGKGKKGEKTKLAMPIDVSNLKLICTQCKKATRVSYVVSEVGKVRTCKQCKKSI